MYSREETPNHAATSLVFYMSVPCELSISPPAAPPIVCVCAASVFTTTPVIRSPPLLLTQLRCITQAVVAAFYLAPASRLPSWRVRWPTQMHKARPRAPEPELMTTVTSVKSCRYGPPVSSCPSLNQRRDLCSLKGQMPIWQSTVDAAWWEDG